MTLPIEQSLFIIKPDAAPIANLVLARVLAQGLDLVNLARVDSLPRSIWELHYAEHEERPYFDKLIDFQVSGPVTVAGVEGPDAISRLRALNGPTKLNEAPVGTIRGDFRQFSTGDSASTLVHASDSAESAARELEIWGTLLGWLW